MTFRPEDITPGETQEGCAGLVIIDSIDVEMTESLKVEIELAEGTPTTIRTQPATSEARIDIIDDDSMFTK